MTASLHPQPPLPLFKKPYVVQKNNSKQLNSSPKPAMNSHPGQDTSMGGQDDLQHQLLSNPADQSPQANDRTSFHSPLPASHDTAAKRCELIHIFLSSCLEGVKSTPENYDADFLQAYERKQMDIVADGCKNEHAEPDTMTRWHADEAAWARLELAIASKHQQQVTAEEARLQVAQHVLEGLKMVLEIHTDKLCTSPEGLRVYGDFRRLELETTTFVDAPSRL